MLENYPEDIDLSPDNDDDEYLTKIIVDTCARKFIIWSNEGSERDIECDSIDEFMNVLELVRVVVDDDMIIYSRPLVKS
jgi:hypothetical protein